MKKQRCKKTPYTGVFFGGLESQTFPHNIAACPCPLKIKTAADSIYIAGFAAEVEIFYLF